MNSTLYRWLVEAEDSLLRMIRGVFRFVCEELPKRIYNFVVDTIGPLTIRLCRVLALAVVWVMILISPFLLACVCRPSGWSVVGSLVWLVVAVLGSMWGLNRAIKKRNAGLSVSVIRE